MTGQTITLTDQYTDGYVSYIPSRFTANMVIEGYVKEHGELPPPEKEVSISFMVENYDLNSANSTKFTTKSVKFTYRFIAAIYFNNH